MYTDISSYNSRLDSVISHQQRFLHGKSSAYPVENPLEHYLKNTKDDRRFDYGSSVRNASLRAVTLDKLTSTIEIDTKNVHNIKKIVEARKKYDQMKEEVFGELK